MTELRLTVPSGWDKLTDEQLEYFGKVLQLEIGNEELVTRCFLKFTGLRVMNSDPQLIKGQYWYLLKRKKSGKFWLNVDTFSDMVSKLDWLAGEVSLFHNPSRIKGCQGCHWKMYGVSLEEYLLADQAYISFIRTKDQRFIFMLLAVLYRMPTESFDEGKNVERNAHRFRKVSKATLHIIILWYSQVKLWMKQKYPYLFSESGGTPAESVSDYVMGLVTALNNGDITLNEKIRKTDLHEVFFELNRKIEFSKTK